MESATQCSYIGCDKPFRKGRRFHYLPARNAGLCVKWLINSGREDLLTYESNILESMKIAICSDHFQDRDYNKHADLKENTVPIQYWDLGYACELGEIKENNVSYFYHLLNHDEHDLPLIFTRADQTETGKQQRRQFHEYRLRGK